ncbi:MAG: 16S rRNA (guanine(527)-N(7))-methyltransferase RsmG [Armatimonadetes bacterium]|nr:16S rRNA (guanine(527)-N(7))-methyltransferase RsmG [Armatimonadota bacterium]
MSDFAQRLADGAADLGVALAPESVGRLDAYRRILQEWNQSMNLVAEADDETLLEKHFLDALRLAAVLVAVAATPHPLLAKEGAGGGPVLPDVGQPSGVASSCATPGVTGPPPAPSLARRGYPAGTGPTSLVDIGAGAGLPGLVVKAALPELRVVLIESHQRRAAFIREAARAMGLDVEVLPLRAEEAGRLPEHRERHDRVTARRVAELAVLYEYALPLLRPGGVAVLPKGEGLDDELTAAAGVAEKLGGGPPRTMEHRGRRFVVVEKLSATPDAYPRAPGRPTKRPLRGG